MYGESNVNRSWLTTGSPSLLWYLDLLHHHEIPEALTSRPSGRQVLTIGLGASMIAGKTQLSKIMDDDTKITLKVLHYIVLDTRLIHRPRRKARTPRIVSQRPIHRCPYPFRYEQIRNLPAFSPLTESTQLGWASILISVPALGFIKLSFLFFYKRIFCASFTSALSIATTIMIVIVSGWSLSFFLSFLFACRGDFSVWGSSLANIASHCINTETLLLALAISDFLTDIIIIVMPLPMVSFHFVSDGLATLCGYIVLIRCTDLASSIIDASESGRQRSLLAWRSVRLSQTDGQS